jgi:uncharacterized protein YyaL (SSP411 family)
MRWQPWSADAFTESAGTGRLVLLFIRTPWSRGCERMERCTFGDERVRAQIGARMIPVRVDADERPDIAHRYGLDGWPSTLILTADGEVLHGGTYLEPEELVRLLDRTERAWKQSPREIDRRAADARARRLLASMIAPYPQEPSDGTLPERIAASLGFRGPERFLHGDAIVFLIRHGAPGSIATARGMLDAAEASPLCRDDGAVLRCAGGPEWSPAADEITVESQASGLRAFTAACPLDRRYRDRARRLAAFARENWLHASVEVPTDSGASLAAACLAASSALDDPGLARETLTWLERIALATYQPGRGVRHLAAEEAVDFASDYIELMAALLEAHRLTAGRPYMMLAEELGHQLLLRFFDERAGALRDRVHGPDDVGRLVEPVFPFGWNARAAGMLSQVAAAAGVSVFAERSAQLFDWAAARWIEHGLDSATLGLYWPDR